MSHFSVIVFLEGTGDSGNIEKRVGRAIAAYNENADVAPYETDCYCGSGRRPNCDECGGSGKRTTTYNPKSRWDWWVMGGRWTGLLDGYDPEKDPRNIGVCRICAGTGKPTDMEVANSCNGCLGKGTRVKWPTEWARHQGDVASASAVKWSREKRPFAFVTPDGRWFERGKMGWFGYASDENEKDYNKRWNAELRRAKRLGWIAVVVDCHI